MTTVARNARFAALDAPAVQHAADSAQFPPSDGFSTRYPLQLK